MGHFIKRFRSQGGHGLTIIMKAFVDRQSTLIHEVDFEMSSWSIGEFQAVSRNDCPNGRYQWFGFRAEFVRFFSFHFAIVVYFARKLAVCRKCCWIHNWRPLFQFCSFRLAIVCLPFLSLSLFSFSDCFCNRSCALQGETKFFIPKMNLNSRFFFFFHSFVVCFYLYLSLFLSPSHCWSLSILEFN